MQACRSAALRSVFAAAAMLVGAIGSGVACGDTDSSAPGIVLSLSISLNRGSESMACADATEVDRVEVTLLLTDGVTPWPGFPAEADCDAGQFSFAVVQPGEYILDVKALGPLDGTPDAVLYSARETIVLSSAGAPIEVVLEPEVGFLDLAWTFGDDELAPCATEIGHIQVRVGTPGGQAGAFVGQFLCTETPVRLPRPFAAQEYLIRVEALSPQDNLLLFTHTASRFLVRGDNAYLAVLEPLGGRLNLDWQFAVGADQFTDCDAVAVGVADVDIEVRSREGGGGVDRATADCTDAPYPFVANRYTEGRELTVLLTAEGTHRFEGAQDFQMPAGDYDSGRIVLHAVGTATLAVSVVTASCAEDLVAGYEVTVGGPVDLAPQLADFGPDMPSAPLTGLRYGVYQVEVAQQLTDGGVQCRAEGQRRIGARSNDWVPLEF